MSVPALAPDGEDEEGSCLWDLLSDDVVAYEIISKIKALSEYQEPVAPFHPRFVLQCARKDVFVWSPARLFKLLSLKPVGPFIQEVQDALRSKFGGSTQMFFLDTAAGASHPIFGCKNLQRFKATFWSTDALAGLPKLSGSLKELYLRASDFYRPPNSSSGVTENLAALTRLTSLSLSLDAMDQEDIGLDCAFLNGLTALRELFVSPGKDGEDAIQIDFSAVRPLPALESLTLASCVVAPATLAPIGRSANLTSLQFNNCAFEDAPLSRLSTLTSLARLEFKDSPSTFGTPPSNILEGLTCVRFSGIKQCCTPAWISSCLNLCEYKGFCGAESAFALLRPLTRLTSLRLILIDEGEDLKCTSLSPLSSLVGGLQDLEIVCFCELQDFSVLARMTALTRLCVQGPFDEPFAGFAPLASLPSLRHLEATDIRRFAEGQFEHLARLTTFTHLSLAGSAVHDAASAPLRALAKNLRSLDLYSTSISDQGVRDTLVHLTNLTNLDVQGKGVTIEGLRCLSSLRRLKSLGTDYNLKKTAEDIRRADPSFLSGVSFVVL